MRILIVDDDKLLRFTLEELLARGGHQVEAVANGEECLAAVAERQFDLIVLDWMMPRMDGLETCRRVREQSTVPILMLTARFAEVDKVKALHAGADDYITKPFGPREFLARIHAIGRRAQMAPMTVDSRLTVGDLTIDAERLEVAVDGRAIRVTPTELRLLQALAASPGRPQRVAELMRRMGFGEQDDADAVSLIKTNVLRVRRKIEPDPGNPRYLVTHHGVGYALSRSGGEST